MDPLNTEFIRLLAKSGWNQSEAARRLELTPAAISRYLTGETRPSLSILKLLKLMLGDTAPFPGSDQQMADLKEAGGGPPMDAWVQDFLLELRRLEVEDQKTFCQHARGLLTLVPKRDASYGPSRPGKR